MSNRVETFANEAIFVLQFNTREAVRYVMRNARTDELSAQKAVQSAVTFHKH